MAKYIADINVFLSIGVMLIRNKSIYFSKYEYYEFSEFAMKKRGVRYLKLV
jgi:hypothetical protein